ncbi:alpha/beta hydrolase [Mycolicibacter sp. MYC123]|uniref:Alpha/beta hydrolase n=1 Tax=[Mycobacterium] zoologicum TaxID=2872311 RepID=A0ABU5YID4_9MYCO|nr:MULTISPECIES: alpha/beta hydrolase [unclassified Mycolicibacter]MEB3049812.1 alpha/beta hydrolase [Mycolicibacter sp. MYC123]MEB3064097.1 alpha/beta hydrolase [Mycolicibacter sp. MYC101]
MSEFALLAGNAEQAGVTGPLPAVARVQSGDISALRFGTAPARVVFLHGGAQNAHTWDTVALGLGEPALSVDLPGHGRSAWREDGDYSPQRNADTLVPVLRELAPAAELVVGMSLGGLTAIRMAATTPELVRRLAIVDVTPSALQRHSQMSAADRGTVALAEGDRSFADFDAMFDMVKMAAPGRDPESLRRGLIHNTRQLPDGRWTWRYDTIRTVGDFAPLWDDVTAVTAPTTLIRGGDSGFVTDDDVAEYARRCPGLSVHVVAGSGHSVQGDQPRALVELLRAALP